MDKLEEMFKMQHELNARILGSKADQLMRENKTEWLLKYSRALQQEVSELIDCDGVAQTTYALSAGVPNALWGLILYLIIIFGFKSLQFF